MNKKLSDPPFPDFMFSHGITSKSDDQKKKINNVSLNDN